MSVIVIGGGITGLSAAWQLASEGRAVTLIEPGPLGGLLRTENVDGCTVECGADSWVRQKPWLRDLATQVGLGDDVLPSNEGPRRTLILRGGKLVPFPRGMRLVAPGEWRPLLTSGLLGWGTKVRMLLETRRAPGPQSDRSVADFVRDHFGDEAVEYLAEPLFAGVYGGTPEALGAEGVLPKLFEYERKFGSLVKGARSEPSPQGPIFESMRDGLGEIPARLGSELARKGARIVKASAEAVSTGRVRVGGEWLDATEVVLACGAPASARLLEGSLTGNLLGKIAHTSATIFALIFRREDLRETPAGFGFLVPRRERKTVLAATWVTNKFPLRAPPDRVVLRCFVSGDFGEEKLPDVLADLQRITGISAAPVASRVYRWPESLPQYGVGHVRFIEEVKTSVPAGLHLSGAFLRGVGMPDCVRSGRVAAARIVECQARA